jgi:hypothetical protein
MEKVLGAIIEHTGEPELWRRYLALHRRNACPPGPNAIARRGRPASEFEQAPSTESCGTATTVASSTRDAHRRAAES